MEREQYQALMKKRLQEDYKNGVSISDIQNTFGVDIGYIEKVCADISRIKPKFEKTDVND